jgi:hypothetical protein
MFKYLVCVIKFLICYNKVKLYHIILLLFNIMKSWGYSITSIENIEVIEVFQCC